jgi:hypothetical protein
MFENYAKASEYFKLGPWDESLLLVQGTRTEDSAVRQISRKTKIWMRRVHREEENTPSSVEFMDHAGHLFTLVDNESDTESAEESQNLSRLCVRKCLRHQTEV